jgi:hypothetical protein
MLTPEQRTQVLQAETTFKTPSVRRATFWLLKPAQELTPDQETFITQLCAISTEIQEVRALSHAFAQMLRERHAGGLRTWLENAEQSAVSEIHSFATGIRQDEAAVTGALTYAWSNGQVEGQINKLKLIKRQMYGRAKLDCRAGIAQNPGNEREWCDHLLPYIPQAIDTNDEAHPAKPGDRAQELLSRRRLMACQRTGEEKNEDR